MGTEADMKTAGALWLLLLGAAGAATTLEVAGYAPFRDRSTAKHAKLEASRSTISVSGNIQSTIAGITEATVRVHLEQLSGEAANSTQITRHSASVGSTDGIVQAAEYVQRQMESYGFDSTLDYWRSGYGPNVVSVLRGERDPEEIVIVGAHLDSRNGQMSDSTGRAPGANDDGSGSSALLAMAQAISESGATFAKTLVFEHYTGEEQGLLGSRDLSRRRASDGDDVIAQIQTDMIGVQLAQDPMGLAFVQDSRAVDSVLSDYVEDVARAYADPALTIYHTVISGSNCCSDHQSYAEAGYASVGTIEPRGYTGDPQYHRAGDLVDRSEYNVEQVALSAQVLLAGAADLAEQL